MNTTPRVNAVIGEVMAKHQMETPNALAKYFEEVHQELAPLAREMEQELGKLREDYASLNRLVDSQERQIFKMRGIQIAAKNLIAMKGRYNTEQAYQRLVDAVGKQEGGKP